MVYRDESRDRSCSPDRLISDKKGLEIKCPELKTHIKYCLLGGLPLEYKMQVHGSMYICNADEWDFFSFHPQYEHFLITIERDWDIDRAIHKALDDFCNKLADAKAKIDSRVESSAHTQA